MMVYQFPLTVRCFSCTYVHIVVRFCSQSDPACIWNTFNNTSAPGGTQNRALDVPSCQAACIATAYCIGIDIDQNPNAVFCWLTVVPQTTGAMSPFTNVVHYTLTRNLGCPLYG